MRWNLRRVTEELMKVASIDIGTNTILLLIAKVEGGKIHPFYEKETVARLGEGLQKNGVLLPEAMERAIRTLAQYLEQSQEMGVQEIFAAGTSALREAKNAQDFLKLAREKLGLSVEVISGEEEAQLSFLAVAKDLQGSQEPTLVVDIGGGSSEFILGKGDQIDQWVSLPMGSVRFAEEFLHSDPVREEEWRRMEKKIRELLRGIPRSREKASLVAVGGTATTLASVQQGLEDFIPEKIHHFVLKRKALKNQLLLYRSKTIEARKKIPGLPSSRADVIPAGGAILYLAMEALECPAALISCHGVRYGLVYKKLNL